MPRWEPGATVGAMVRSFAAADLVVPPVKFDELYAA
jgi:hypothetical protein